MIIFGKDAQTNNSISVSLESLHAGSYILGLPGTGKSTLLNSLATQLMKQGESVIVFDPKGDLVDGIIGTMPKEAVDNTYLLDITNHDWPFALNVFSFPDPKNISHKDRAAIPNRIYQAFAKQWPEVERGRFFKNILWATIPILLEHPTFTLFDVRDFLEDENMRLRILKDITDIEALRYWRRYNNMPPSKQADERKPFEDRMDEFFRDPYVKFILCQKQGLVDFREAIIQKKHFLIKLPILESAYQYAGKTIGIFLLLQIYAATFSFAAIPQHKRPKFTLIIDEFSQFAFGGEEVGDLFNFGRGLGIRQILAHQTREQLKTDESLKPIVGITKGARTVVCLRLNPIDASDMASIFTGLTRRPTDIYIDVLDRLEKHPHAKVKEFYWHYVTKLQQAAKQTEREGYVYTFDFGFEAVEYKPTKAKETERLLNNLLYYAQKEQRIDESRLNTFLHAYGELAKLVKIEKQIKVDNALQKRYDWILSEQARLNKLVLPDGVLTPEEKQKIQEYKAQSDSLWEEMLAGYELVKLVIRDLTYTNSLDANGNMQLRKNWSRYKIDGKAYHSKLERDDYLRGYFQGKGFSFCDERGQEVSDAGYWLLKEKNKLPANYVYFRASDLHNPLFIAQEIYKKGRETVLFLSAQYGEDVDIFDPNLQDDFSKLVVRENKPGSINRFKELCRRFLTLREKHQKQGFIRCENLYEEALRYSELKGSIEYKTEQVRYHIPFKKLQAEANEILNREIDVWKQKEKIEKLIRDVLSLLIADPVAADKAELSSADVETLLQNLPLRQAYVKSDSHISTMKTYDLPAPIPYPEFRQRKDQIASQTRKKYAPKGRATIQKEMTARFLNSSDGQSADPEGSVQKLAKKTGHKNRQQTTVPHKHIDEEDDIIE